MVAGGSKGFQIADESYQNILKNNILFNNGVYSTPSYIAYFYPGTQGNGNVLDNNAIYTTGPIKFFWNSANYSSVASFQTASGLETHSIWGDPLFSNASASYTLASDFIPMWNSPVIDAGTDVGLTSDYLGNPIYGLPDIGPIEYQPPYSMGTDKPDTAANIRIYGDGKFRNTLAPDGTLADLAVIPASANTRHYLDVVISSWSNSGNRHKTWTESSTTITGSVSHTVGDLEADTDYIVSVDTIPSSNISGANGTLCSSGICRSNGSGKLSFSYSGGYSSHTFDIQKMDLNSFQTLNVIISGSGGGSVTSAPQGTNPVGISCTSGSCSSTFPPNIDVVLTPSADNISTFGSWGGACSGSGGCSVTMNGPKAVSASFDLAPKAKIIDAPYSALNDAYMAAASGDTIDTIDSELPDSGLDINAALGQGKNITIMGGWKADYSARSGLFTYLKGQLKISSGRLAVDGLKLR